LNSRDSTAMSFLQIRGVRYNVEIEGFGPPLVLLHGFTGSAESWSDLVPVVKRNSRVIAIDLLGHGKSDAPADPPRYSTVETNEDLMAILDWLKLPRVNLLGYSMGGRVALSFAIAAPGRVDRLILESASPGLESSDARAERVRGDETLASLLDRDGLEAFVDRWEQVPLFSSQQDLAPDIRKALRRQRLRGSAIGLASSLRGLGTGTMAPLYDRLGQATCKTLLIVGELDQKYRTFGEHLASALPDARLVVVPKAGHAVHLEQPVVFGHTVSDFLESRSSVESGSLGATLAGGG
jgi:2-succinyl-6-hydroxy-2,4-cyclohexadiene-1-carboxylate synthase